MAEPIRVTLELSGSDVEVGTLYPGRLDTVSFRYSDGYLARPGAFPLGPDLPLVSGTQPLHALGPFADSAPDTWGRKVLNRAHPSRRMGSLDLLLGTNDVGRNGALRFWLDGVALAPGDGVPSVQTLAELLSTADDIGRDRDIRETPRAQRLLEATGSLGGARPKANVRIGDEMWIAKFPKPIGDAYDVIAWEFACNRALLASGIDAAPARREVLGGRNIGLYRRFDRGPGGSRIPFLSAMSALGASDGDGGDWVDLVDVTLSHGGSSHELFRRAAFGALIGNTDDHLRNHAFLRRGPAWELSPAFDVNPTPGVGGEHQLALFGDAEVTLEKVCAPDSLRLFRVRPQDAHAWLPRLGEAVAGMRDVMSGPDIEAASRSTMDERFASAAQQIRSVAAR